MPRGIYRDKTRYVGGKKGRKFSEEAKLKLSLAHLGQTAWNKGLKGYRAGLSRGTPPKGELHYRYITDRTKLKKKKERNDAAYFEWRKNVWLRDGYICKLANPDCSGKIEAHHINGWAEYPELRYQNNNGITLCHAHHPRKRAEEKRLAPIFQGLVSVSRQ